METFMKNKFLVVVLAILLLTPGIVGIINYALMQGGQADTANEALAALEKKLAGFHSDMSKIKLVLDQKCGMSEALKQDKGLSAKVSDINATKTDKQITRK